jgi:hypothetical protein
MSSNWPEDPRILGRTGEEKSEQGTERGARNGREKGKAVIEKEKRKRAR